MSNTHIYVKLEFFFLLVQCGLLELCTLGTIVNSSRLSLYKTGTATYAFNEFIKSVKAIVEIWASLINKVILIEYRKKLCLCHRAALRYLRLVTCSVCSEF